VQSGKIYLGIILLLLFSCSRSEEPPKYHTWNSLKEMEYWSSVFPIPDEIPLKDFFPWAGITSHHILSHEYLDAYFSYLARKRDVKRFFVLSPDHYGVSLRSYSLTIGSWDSGFGFVESDKKKVHALLQALDVELDPDVFIYEHGISAIMPYIKKYFPYAQVVAIIHGRESVVNTLISGFLADVLEEEFDESGKQENFLLISADFSHGENQEATYLNDFNSRRYLIDTINVSWNNVCCDNRAGIYILDRLGKKNLESVIFYHTNSWEISGQEEDDITSYFFAYFADKL